MLSNSIWMGPRHSRYHVRLLFSARPRLAEVNMGRWWTPVLAPRNLNGIIGHRRSLDSKSERLYKPSTTVRWAYIMNIMIFSHLSIFLSGTAGTSSSSGGGVRVSHKTGHGVKLGGAGVAPASNGGGGVDGDYQLVQHEVSMTTVASGTTNT